MCASSIARVRLMRSTALSSNSRASSCTAGVRNRSPACARASAAIFSRNAAMCASSLAIHPPRRRRVGGGVLRFVGIVSSGRFRSNRCSKTLARAAALKLLHASDRFVFDDSGEQHGYSFECTTDERGGIDGRTPPRRAADRDADAHAKTPAGGAARWRAAG
ncbi:hypothetical protein BCEN4_2080012 [Burkholderia cenocepacia]|nr:hypothetical protein BCEN4_2080012 [Burkholderia cenocepacia]